jgi:hypothetical protein
MSRNTWAAGRVTSCAVHVTFILWAHHYAYGINNLHLTNISKLQNCRCPGGSNYLKNTRKYSTFRAKALWVRRKISNSKRSRFYLYFLRSWINPLGFIHLKYFGVFQHNLRSATKRSSFWQTSFPFAFLTNMITSFPKDKTMKTDLAQKSMQTNYRVRKFRVHITYCAPWKKRIFSNPVYVLKADCGSVIHLS